MEWPEEFLERDADLGLRQVRGFVADDLVSMRDVGETLAAVRTSPQVGPNLRVAVEGGYRQDTRQRLIDSDPAFDHEPLDLWAERLFADKPFYVVVNELEVFNPALVRRLARAMRPIMESQASWFGGFSFALLIGRGGFTSFGIHRDSGCRWNLQFHIGPSSKTMTVWPGDTLDGASAADLLATEPLLASGRSFRLDRGDLFVLPCTERHGALYGDLAVTLVASMKTQSERALLEAALRRLLDESQKRAPAPDIPLTEPIVGSSIAAGVSWDEAALRVEIEGERLRRWSNLGMAVRNAQRLPAVGEIAGSTLSIVDPFPICWQQLGDGRLRVFARGHSLNIVGGEEAVSPVERLGAGESIEVGAKIPPVAAMVLTFLLGHGAVEDVQGKP